MDSPGLLPETSNFYCLSGRTRGSPIVLVMPYRIMGTNIMNSESDEQLDWADSATRLQRKHGVDISETLLRGRHRRGIGPAYLKPSQRTENVAVAEVLSVCKQFG